MSLPLLFSDVFGDGRDDPRARRPRLVDVSAAACVEGTPDTALVQSIRTGDRAAFDELVGTSFAMLARCAYEVVRSRDEAEDVAQEVLVTVWTHRTTWAPRASVRAYLLAAARRRALNRVRRSDVEARHVLDITRSGQPALFPAPDSALAAGDAGQRLDVALGTLTSRAREAVLLRYDAQCTFPEIAHVLGVSLPAAQKLVQRAVVQLRVLLADLR